MENAPATVERNALEILSELGSAFAQWQAALLAQRPLELETCTTRQRGLCGELKQMISAAELALHRQPQAGQVISKAGRVRQQGLVFAATLRRMRRNLIGLRQALSGAAYFYQQPDSRRQPAPLPSPGSRVESNF